MVGMGRTIEEIDTDIEKAQSAYNSMAGQVDAEPEGRRIFLNNCRRRIFDLGNERDAAVIGSHGPCRSCGSTYDLRLVPRNIPPTLWDRVMEAEPAILWVSLCRACLNPVRSSWSDAFPRERSRDDIARTT